SEVRGRTGRSGEGQACRLSDDAAAEIDPRAGLAMLRLETAIRRAARDGLHVTVGAHVRIAAGALVHPRPKQALFSLQAPPIQAAWQRLLRSIDARIWIVAIARVGPHVVDARLHRASAPVVSARDRTDLAREALENWDAGGFTRAVVSGWAWS